MTTTTPTNDYWLRALSSLTLVGCVSLLACSEDPSAGTPPLTAGGTGATTAVPLAGTAAPTTGGSIATAGVGPAATAGVTGASTAGTTAPRAGTTGAGAGTTGGSIAVAGTGAGVGAPIAGTTAAGTGGTAGTAAPVAEEVMGCGTTKLLKSPEDPGAVGPWPVGVKTVKLATTGGMMTTEIWYPAQPGSEVGKTQVTYDLSLTIPPPDRTKIPAAENNPQPCNCYRDLPLDTAHGPYPPVVFLHGLASFRTGSLSAMTQWASRGFIVVAGDHLGLWLLDFSSGTCGGGGSGGLADFAGDLDKELAALKNKTGDFAFLGDSVDMERVAVGGHSTGAAIACGASGKPNVQVIILLAELGGAAVRASSSIKSVLVMGGMADTVTQWSADLSAYRGSPMKKRLVGLTGGDHLDVTDICAETNPAGQNSIEVGKKHDVCALKLVDGLAHCGGARFPDVKQGPASVNYVSTAILEETLHCADRSASLEDATLKAKFPAIGAYEHAL